MYQIRVTYLNYELCTSSVQLKLIPFKIQRSLNLLSLRVLIVTSLEGTHSVP